MSVPKPPFHSTIEELLYNIYLKLQSGAGPGGGLTMEDIDTLAKLNAILTDADLLSSQEVNNLILALKGNVPASGDTLEKLYNIIAGLNYLTQQDIDTIAEINAIINDADLAKTADIDALLDNVPEEGDSLNKLYNLITGLGNADLSPPSLFCDFDVVVVNISLGTFNTGGGLGAPPAYSTFGVDTTENCFGVIKLSTAGSTAGGSYLSSVYPNIALGLAYKIVVKARLALETLSDNSNNYYTYFGLGGPAVTVVVPVNGVFFRYNHLLNNGRVEAVCKQAGIETSADTGFIADVDTFHIFEIRINPAGTIAEFFIDDLDTPVATIVDNIPNGAAQALVLFGKIEKTAGATARNLYFDYVKYVPTRTLPR